MRGKPTRIDINNKDRLIKEAGAVAKTGMTIVDLTNMMIRKET